MVTTSTLADSIVRSRIHIILCSIAATWGWARVTGGFVTAGDFLVVSLTMASVYSWNRLEDGREDCVNDPVASRHAADHRSGISLFCCIAACGAVGLSLLHGDPSAVGYVLLVLLLGLLYSTPIRGPVLRRRLKEVFLVKNLTSAVGWSVLTIIYPAVHTGTPIELMHWCAVGVMFAAVWNVEIIWDIRDREGDRLAGIPTIPLRFGMDVSRACVIGLSAFTAALVLGATGFGLLHPVWLFVVTSPVLTGLWVMADRPSWVALRGPSHVLVGLHVFLLFSLGLLAGLVGVQ